MNTREYDAMTDRFLAHCHANGIMNGATDGQQSRIAYTAVQCVISSGNSIADTNRIAELVWVCSHGENGDAEDLPFGKVLETVRKWYNKECKKISEKGVGT